MLVDFDRLFTPLRSLRPKWLIPYRVVHHVQNTLSFCGTSPFLPERHGAAEYACTGWLVLNDSGGSSGRDIGLNGSVMYPVPPNARPSTNQLSGKAQLKMSTQESDEAVVLSSERSAIPIG